MKHLLIALACTSLVCLFVFRVNGLPRRIDERDQMSLLRNSGNQSPSRAKNERHLANQSAVTLVSLTTVPHIKRSMRRVPRTAEQVREEFLGRYGRGEWSMDITSELRWDRLQGPLKNEYMIQEPENAAQDFLKDHPELLENLPPESQLEMSRNLNGPACSAVSFRGRIGNVSLPGEITVGICPLSRELWAHNTTVPIESVESCSEISDVQAAGVVIRSQQSFGDAIILSISRTFVASPGRAAEPAFSVRYDLRPRPPSVEPVIKHVIEVNACTAELMGVPRPAVVY